MPRDYKGRPRNIPSQNPAQEIPYFPGRQADVAQFARLRGPIPHGYAPGGAFVVSTYDSRPINCIEFSHTRTLQQNFGINSSRNVATSTFVVPEGRTCILREWSADIYWLTLHTAGLTSSVVSTNGAPQAPVQIDFLVNGAAVPEFSGLTTGQFCFGSVSGETFIIVPEGQTLQFVLTRIDFPNGNSGQLSNILFEQVDTTLLGQLILSTGQTPDFEIGNQEPLPVDVKAKGVAL